MHEGEVVARRRSPSPQAVRLASWIVWPLAMITALIVVAVSSFSPFTAKVANTSDLAAASYFRCSGAISAMSPYLWYRLDETSNSTTSATDSSGNGRTGLYTNTSGRTLGVARACSFLDTGTAVTFNGTSNYLSSPSTLSATWTTFSLQLWFKTTTTKGGKLIGWGNQRTGPSNQNDRHIYMTDSGQLIFGVYPNAVRTVTSPKAYNDGGWHQAIATLSGAGMRLYVDGALVASDANTTTAESVTGGYWRIAYDNLNGWPSSPSSGYFAGTIDDAVVYQSALSVAQVEAQYEASSPRPSALALSDTNLAFGNVLLVSTSTKTVTLTNTGTTDLTISSSTGPSAPFSISPSLTGRKISSGDTLTVTVTYAPTRASTGDSGSFSFTADDGSAASTVYLTGNAADLALNKTATQSSNYGDFYASRAVDGNPDGVVNNGSVSHTNSTSTGYSWWQVDLGSVTDIGQITLYNRTDCCADRLSNYYVFASSTAFNTSLTPAQQAARSGVWSSRQTTQPNPTVSIDLPAGSRYRYVMVQLNVQNTYLQLAEVVVTPP